MIRLPRQLRLLCLLLLSAIGLRVFAAPRAQPDFGVVFNDDADLAFVAPDRAKSEALLRANISALADTPVKTLVYCIGMGGDLLYYNTQVASRVGWRKAPDETPGSLMEKRMENARVCLAQGADAVRTAGETAKRLGLRFIPSLRMNDAHFMATPEQHSMTSEFWFKHRDRYTIRESPLPFQKAYGNLLDFTHDAVRQLRLDTVYEALERNRDLVDGFELDFNRFQVFFPKGRAAAGAPLITDLVRKVRARLDELSHELKRPMYLFVRIPPSLPDCATAGLEVERWMREGLVDLVSPAQIMTLAGDMPIADLVALGRTHGVVIYPSLYPRTSWRLPFPTSTAERYVGTAVTREATLEEIRGAAAMYRQLGVDGFYLFNFYNAFGSSRPHDDRLYRVFRDVARPENLTGQSKVYVVTKSYYNDGPGSYAYSKQLPAKFAAGNPLRVTLRIAEPIAGQLGETAFPLKTCELRIGFRSLPPDGVITISLNGHPLVGSAGGTPATMTIRAGRPRSQPPQIVKSAPKQRDLAEDYLHVPIGAPQNVMSGENTFVISIADSSRAIEVTDLELRYDYHNELEKIWLREPAKLNE